MPVKSGLTREDAGRGPRGRTYDEVVGSFPAGEGCPGPRDLREAAGPGHELRFGRVAGVTDACVRAARGRAPPLRPQRQRYR